jgi:hypothetical protein
MWILRAHKRGHAPGLLFVAPEGVKKRGFTKRA